jgi:hypothetical protein
MCETRLLHRPYKPRVCLTDLKKWVAPADCPVRQGRGRAHRACAGCQGGCHAQQGARFRVPDFRFQPGLRRVPGLPVLSDM